jgi:hypothetical protein
MTAAAWQVPVCGATPPKVTVQLPVQQTVTPYLKPPERCGGEP